MSLRLIPDGAAALLTFDAIILLLQIEVLDFLFREGTVKIALLTVATCIFDAVVFFLQLKGLDYLIRKGW
jgi:hypothetical protein